MKKGFTLVELLGAIILLGLISLLIAVPIVARINKNSDRIDNATLKILKEYVLQYISENSNDFRSTKPGTKYYMTLDELGFNRDGYEVTLNKKKLNPDIQVLIEIDSNGNYEVSILDNAMPNIKSKNIGDYVLFNGFNWKIISKDSTNKTVKLACNEFVGSVYTGTDSLFSETYTYKWLNKEFASKLNYISVIKQSTFGNIETLIGVPTKQENTSYNISNYVYSVLDGNNLATSNSGTNTAPLIRPVINVYEGTIITGGTGTASSPYVLRKYNNDQNGTGLKEADISVGEYVSFDGKLYRIIEYGSDTIKLISTFSEGTSSYSNTNETFNLNNGAGYQLNSSNVSNYMLMNNVFAGAVYSVNADYENTTLKKSNIVYQVYKALPKIGDILTAPIDTNTYWTINLQGTGQAYTVGPNGLSSSAYSSSINMLYTTYISADNIIIGGIGTKTDPYVLQ